MHKLIKIKRDYNYNIPKKVIKYLSPDFCYVPLPNDILFDSDTNKTYVNQFLYNDLKYPYSASISGKIIGTENRSIKGITVNCLSIKNDFKERKAPKEKYHEIIFFEDLISMLDNLRLFSLKEKLNVKNVKYLVFNCICDDVFQFNESQYLLEYSDEILETLDNLLRILKIGTCTACIKNIDSTAIESFISVIGSYTNINARLFEDKYLLARKFFICEQLAITDKSTIMLTPYDVYQLYNVIKYNKRVDNKIISITDTVKRKNYLMQTKIYTPVSELLKNVNRNLKSDELLICGSLLTGNESDSEKEIVTDESSSYYIIKGNLKAEEECSNCGKCYQICPVKVNPKLSMDNHKKNKNCIDCGLCSYICPSYINLRRFLKGEKDE